MLVIMMTDKLICKIMIYRLPVRDSIDRDYVDGFKEELKELME